MGLNVKVEGSSAVLKGSSPLSGAKDVYKRQAYPALLGEYNLAVTDITTDVSVKTAMRLNAYDSYRTYDEIKPEVERIINLAKSDRYIEYEALGLSLIHILK